MLPGLLGNPTPKSYTSYTFRRTGATWLAEAGVSLAILKIAGGWRSNTVAEHYINESTLTKRKIGDALATGEYLEENVNPNIIAVVPDTMVWCCFP